MKKQTILVSLFIAVVLGLLMAFAGSQNGQTVGAIPIYAICVAFAFLLNWAAFVPAYAKQTERFFDLTGSITYISLVVLAFVCSDNLDLRSILLGGMCLIWAIRLGTFLFLRIHRAGKDDRFDVLKTHALRFFNTWTLQAVWVVLTSAPVIIAITSNNRKDIGIVGIIGVVIWLIGFAIEMIADGQKSAFKKDASNQGKFISTGLWSRSRHPNYFGEIMLWVGATIVAVPVLQGWQWIALISPVFVTFLLTKVSGIPMLQAKAEKKWGGQTDYEEYKSNTPVLIPKLF